MYMYVSIKKTAISQLTVNILVNSQLQIKYKANYMFFRMYNAGLMQKVEHVCAK